MTWMSRKTASRCSVAIRPDNPAGGQPVAPGHQSRTLESGTPEALTVEHITCLWIICFLDGVFI
jgi:hypothetical protein